MIKVKRQATGWTIKMAESVVRAELGSSNVDDWEAVKILDVSYPISMPLHSLPLQKPKTPKSTPSKVPKGTALIIGVDKTESNSMPNAANSKTVNGVAGRNMAAGLGVRADSDESRRYLGPFQTNRFSSSSLSVAGDDEGVVDRAEVN